MKQTCSFLVLETKNMDLTQTCKIHVSVGYTIIHCSLICIKIFFNIFIYICVIAAIRFVHTYNYLLILPNISSGKRNYKIFSIIKCLCGAETSRILFVFSPIL